ncbi:hypothetical protein CEXT_186261 [Caerostris extrusa]|uniref:Cationic amino acid transporter C-terminal domain-containing protein n=1 Tax=Caerostris extrusa TaxID=172846 RepID=A0AAV4SW51_CAEEX|nr:hypothetical protein CEXT_186261 [Caerostris extrusa]
MCINFQDHGSADAHPSLPLDQPRRSFGSYGYLCDEDGGGALLADHHHGPHRGVRHARARKQERGSHLLPARLPVRHYLLFDHYLATAADQMRLEIQSSCVPFIPGIAITVNIYLIFKLSVLTLVRFLIWMSFMFLLRPFHVFLVRHQEQLSELQTDKPLELKIPQDRVQNNLCPPDNNQYMMAGGGNEVIEESYVEPAYNGYVAQPDPLSVDPWSQPDPLAEDPWAKYN